MPYNPSGDLEFDPSEFSHHHNRMRYSSPNIQPGHVAQGVGGSFQSGYVGWNVEPPVYQQSPYQYQTPNYGPPAAVPFSYTQGPAQSMTPGVQKKQFGPTVTAVEQVKLGRGDTIDHAGDLRDTDVFDGSLKKRKIRDVICLGMFVAFMGLMAAMAGYALFTGDFNRVVDGSSSECASTRSGKAGANGTDVMDVYEDNEFSFEEFARQMEKSWPSLVYMCLVAVGLAIAMTAMLRLFAGVIVWVVLGLFVSAAAVGTTALWIVYVRTDDDTKKTAMLVTAAVVTLVAVIFVLVLVSMRKRIMLVIQLFKEAGKAVHAIPLLLIQPFWTFIFQVAASAAFVSLAVLIETSRVKDEDGNCRRPMIASVSRWLNIFAYFWMIQFIIGCQHIVIAGAISQWFFTRNKSKLRSPILRSLNNLLRYHLGSVAFGSLIIAIVKFLRYLLNMAKRRLGSKTNLILACCNCVCSCCLMCLDKFLQYLNRNAYIEIAIYGYAFCPAAKRAFKVIANNALRIAAINSIGDFVLWLGKITIVALSGVCGYYIFKANLSNNEPLDYEWALIVVGMVFAYFTAHCFISTYEMAMDTIFVCFCEDLEMNDGVQKPYFMSKGLMKFVKANKKLEEKEKKKSK